MRWPCSFDLVIDLSNIWTDPDGLLADHMRAGRSVLVWGRAAGALGIDDNVVVQAFIGADIASGGSDKLLTTATDPILGGRPVGTEIADCADSTCLGVDGADAHPDAKVLARLDAGSSGNRADAQQVGGWAFRLHVRRHLSH